MSMEHKAFLFDTKKYHRDIEPVLRECIRTQSSDAAEAYITAHLPELTSPYTGGSRLTKIGTTNGKTAVCRNTRISC